MATEEESKSPSTMSEVLTSDIQALEETLQLLNKQKKEALNEMKDVDAVRVANITLLTLEIQKQIDAAIKKNDEEKKQNKILQDGLNIRKATSEEIEDYIKQLKIALEIEQDKGVKDERAIENIKELIKQSEKRLEKIKQEKNILGSITGELSTQIKNLFDITAIYTTIGTLVNDTLNANKEFAAQTGRVADRTYNFGTGMSQFGIGIKEMNTAAIGLYKSMSNFSELNVEMQQNLAGSTAKLGLLGVSADIVGNNLNSLTKAFGMSAQQALETNQELAKAAIAAGIAPSKMLSEFSANLPRLAAYGKQAKDVFIDMEKQAKSLGMELGILNGIVGDQFDTFEGAARAAGKYNAVLGGNFLNSVEMLNATESERILLLKQSFEASGRSFDSLDKYQKKAIAATIGIQDLNEASKFFSKSTSELTMDMQKKAVTDEQLAKVEREAADAVAQLKNAFNGLLVIIMPLVSIFKTLVGFVSSLNDATGGYLPVLALVVYLTRQYWSALSAVWGSLKAVTAAIKGMQIVSTVSELFTKAATALRTFGTASVTTAVEIEVGGTAAGTAAVGFSELALAILAIGAGIGIAAAGIALFVYSIANLFNSITDTNVKLIFELSVALSALTMTLAMFMVASLGFGPLLAGIVALGVALRAIPDNKVITLKTLNETLSHAKTLREEDIKPTKDFVRVIKDYYEVQAKSKDADKDALVAALKEIMSSGKEEAQSSEETTPIKLVISGTDLAYALNNGNASVAGTLMSGPRSFRRRNG